MRLPFAAVVISQGQISINLWEHNGRTDGRTDAASICGAVFAGRPDIELAIANKGRARGRTEVQRKREREKPRA